VEVAVPNDENLANLATPFEFGRRVLL
jgi:hypothetical protein